MTSAQLWDLVLAVACGLLIFLIGWHAHAQVSIWRAEKDAAERAYHASSRVFAGVDEPVPYRLSQAAWLETDPVDAWITRRGGPWYGASTAGLPDPMDIASAGYALGQRRAEQDDIGRQVDAMILEYDAQHPRRPR